MGACLYGILGFVWEKEARAGLAGLPDCSLLSTLSSPPKWMRMSSFIHSKLQKREVVNFLGGSPNAKTWRGRTGPRQSPTSHFHFLAGTCTVLSSDSSLLTLTPSLRLSRPWRWGASEGGSHPADIPDVPIGQPQLPIAEEHRSRRSGHHFRRSIPLVSLRVPPPPSLSSPPSSSLLTAEQNHSTQITRTQPGPNPIDHDHGIPRPLLPPPAPGSPGRCPERPVQRRPRCCFHHHSQAEPFASSSS